MSGKKFQEKKEKENEPKIRESRGKIRKKMFKK